MYDKVLNFQKKKNKFLEKNYINNDSLFKSYFFYISLILTLSGY